MLYVILSCLYNGLFKKVKLASDQVLIQRSFKARCLHAVLFELVAILLTALFFTIVMGSNIIDMGILSVLVSLLATVWNGIFNYLFDCLQRHFDFSRTKCVRVLHSAGFEGGLIFLTIPLVMHHLRIDFYTACLLEASCLSFFLPYSIFFNYSYDKIYKWMVVRKLT